MCSFSCRYNTQQRERIDELRNLRQAEGDDWDEDDEREDADEEEEEPEFEVEFVLFLCLRRNSS